MTALTVALATLVGLSLGLLGGGGSILMVPLLAYVAGLEASEAIATSLLVVGVTSAVSVVSHARAGRVRWRIGLLFGAAGMAGAYTGGLVSGFIPGSLLLVGFAAIMITAAIAMLRGRRERPGAGSSHAMPTAKVVLEGAGVGFVTGLVGAGGGFLVVPALHPGRAAHAGSGRHLSRGDRDELLRRSGRASGGGSNRLGAGDNGDCGRGLCCPRGRQTERVG